MNKSSYYYNIEDDINKYKDAWCYIIVGGRNTGKTYSTLKSCKKDGRKFTFTKRTNDDVNLLCAGSGKIGTKLSQYGVDLSPFKSINRDTGYNVKPFKIFEGLGGFWDCDCEDNPEGVPIGYIVSLNAVSKVKGFDLSDSEWLVFDEFIPQPWERVSRKEGEQVLDLYKTIDRDRQHRGKPALKLICLANATTISNPLMGILEITDIVAQMNIDDTEYYYDDYRKILIHRVKDSAEFYEVESNAPIYKAMKGTQWGTMALENKFAYDDFTSVQFTSLKGYKCIVQLKYKENIWYIYKNGSKFYMCESRANTGEFYDLNRENDQKRFYIEHCIDLRNACIENRMKFSKYTMYDIIVNFKKFFKI